MKKLLGLFIATIAILTGCANGAASNDTQDADKTASACSQNDVKIGMVTDSGGVNDKSFNQGTWEAIEEYCAANGVGAEYVESADDSQYVPNLNSMAAKAEVVVASGFLFSTAIYESAVANPDVLYILIDSTPSNPNELDENNNPVEVELPNVHSYFFNEAEAGYLVGYIAAKETQKDNLGFVGGMEIPPVQKFGWGYLQGVAAAKEGITVNYQYAGSFDDTTAGKTIAASMYQAGADIIFTAAGGVNSGVINAAIEANTGDTVTNFVIGVDRDMYDVGKFTPAGGEEQSVILTSAMKELGTAVKDGLDDWANGTFKSGVTLLQYADNGVGVPATNPNLEGKDSLIEEAKKSLADTDVATDAEGTKAAIDGKVTVLGKY